MTTRIRSGNSGIGQEPLPRDLVSGQEERYRQLVLEFGAPLGRLARAYEADPDLCRDLLQDIHLALWMSLRSFDERCSLRTWVYRVAHNVAASHILKRRRERANGLLGLEDLDFPSGEENAEFVVHRKETRKQLTDLIQRLRPLDRQILLLYLEEVDAAAIGEVTGMSPANVSTKLHRIRRILIRQFHEGA
jgi:RNA polymerase sigma-70 factor (ECF subfamily)